MSKFERGIKSPDFINALNKLRSDPNSFWSKAVKNPKLFVAIRNEYFNIYHKGNSLYDISFVNGLVVGSTHYKYLLQPNLNEYLPFSNGKYDIIKPDDKFITTPSDVELIIRASNVYAGNEKSGVHSIITKTDNILDVEITFEKENKDVFEIRKKTDRIDYLRIEEDNGLKLVFYEAKHFSNPEIRAHGAPKVLVQLEKYVKALNLHQIDIISSYFNVCNNLLQLNLLDKNRPLLKRVADGEPFSIDFEPRLIIFDYDRDQEKGKVWNDHKLKLKTVLGKRLITKGSI